MRLGGWDTVLGITTGNGPVLSDDKASSQYTTWYARFNASTSAGVVTIEEADDPNYSGTWMSLATLTWTAATKIVSITITGPHKAIRARVSTTIVGGTVDISVITAG